MTFRNNGSVSVEPIYVNRDIAGSPSTEAGGRNFSAVGQNQVRGGKRNIAALPGLFADRRRTALRIEEIDGEPASRSPHAPLFASAGFRTGYKGLELDRTPARPGVS